MDWSDVLKVGPLFKELETIMSLGVWYVVNVRVLYVSNFFFSRV